MSATPNSLRLGPDSHGHFGPFGGRYVAETLMPLLLKLEAAYTAAKDDPQFSAELDGLLFIGGIQSEEGFHWRPTSPVKSCRDRRREKHGHARQP